MVYRRFLKEHFPGKTFPGTALLRNVTPTPPRQTTPSPPLLSVAGPTTSVTGHVPVLARDDGSAMTVLVDCWPSRHVTTTSAASTATARPRTGPATDCVRGDGVVCRDIA